MATLESANFGHNPHEQQAAPVPSASEGAMALDGNINGDAVRHNNVSADVSASHLDPQTPGDSAAHKNAPSAPPKDELAPAHNASLPPSNLTSGIAPLAPFVEEHTSHSSLPDDHASATQTLSASDTEQGLSAARPTADAMSDAHAPKSEDAASASLAPGAAQATSAGLDGTMETMQDIKPAHPTMDQEMTDVSAIDASQSTKVAREREDDDMEEPSAKRTKTESPGSNGASSPVLPSTEIPEAQTVPSATVPQNSTATPANAGTTADGQVRKIFATDPAPVEEWGKMTDVQKSQLKQHLQNLKKGRHAAAFTKPVDHVALNIPTYPQIIKQPMDLSTMDRKMREGRYTSVADYIDDFNLIIDNCLTFNGPNHVISMAAQSLRAQFVAGLRRVPKVGEGASSIEPKKRRSSLGPLPQREAKPREPRAAPPTPAATNGTTNQTFALPQDGNPLIRRTSTGLDGRPKREIHKPAPRDLPYSSFKPKKKKYQMELKFCEHVLGELKKGRYSHLMYPFRAPVDPVALNIPNYFKVVKNPMDFETITNKLSNGQYENAKDFEIDVRRIFENSVKFNGPAHPVSQLGKQLESHFDQEMSQKSNWIAVNAPASAPHSPDAESEEDEDDEEEEEEVVVNEDRDEAIKSIHQQIAELSQKAMALSSAPAPKKVVKDKKKGKTAKPATAKAVHKPASAQSSRPEKKVSKPKPAKPVKILSGKEKEEISERIGELNGEETAKAAELIKAGLRKVGRHDLADRPDEELEFDIDAIPNDVLYQLLLLVRRNDSTSDYRPLSQIKASTTNGSSKHRKHKPMAPDAADASDDDDDDEGSESEEE